MTDDGHESDGAVVVTSSGEGAFRQSVRAGAHLFVADEPAPVSGDEGPSPYDLLLASLGSCTSMTIGMYAKRKGWPLEGVSVRLTHERRHSDDCDDPDGHPSRITHITRMISLAGPLDEDQHRRLMEVAERCPVHLTLTGPIHIETTPG